MIAKARVAQLIGFRPMPAAAECPVTFGYCFYRWKARLWGWWGSSCTAGAGGRLAAAPTAYPKMRLIFCRARCPIGPFPGGPVCRPYEMRESSGLAVGADDLGGPRAHSVRPYSRKRARRVGSAKPGAVVKPHHLKFPTKPGPCGPAGI